MDGNYCMRHGKERCKLCRKRNKMDGLISRRNQRRLQWSAEQMEITPLEVLRNAVEYWLVQDEIDFGERPKTPKFRFPGHWGK